MIKIEFGNEPNNNITIHNVRCRAIYTGCGKNSTRITFRSERLLDPERPMINWTTGEIYADQSAGLISYDRNGSFAKHKNYTVIHMTTAKVGLKPERCLSGKRENRRHIERREGVSKSVQL